MAGDPFHHASRIREDERRVVLRDERCQLVVDRGPDFARHHGLERGARHHECEIAFADVTAVDDLAGGPGSRAGQEARDLLDGPLRGRQPDALHRLRCQRVQPLERQGQVRAALSAGDRVDLVDDHGPRARQHAASGFAREQQVKRFGRRHEDVGREPAHRRALGLRCVAGAHLRANLERRHAEARELGADAGERLLEVALDVVGQRLERRYVHDARRVLKPPCDAFLDQGIDRRQERCQRLTRACGRGDERVAAARDGRPRCGLGHRGTAKARVEPGLDGRVELGGRHKAKCITLRRPC